MLRDACDVGSSGRIARSPRRDQNTEDEGSEKENDNKMSDRNVERSCANCRDNKNKETISSIDITNHCRAIVFYGKTQVLCPIQPEAGMAAAVVGTVWFLHPKAGLFYFLCFVCAG